MYQDVLKFTKACDTCKNATNYAALHGMCQKCQNILYDMYCTTSGKSTKTYIFHWVNVAKQIQLLNCHKLYQTLKNAPICIKCTRIHEIIKLCQN